MCCCVTVRTQRRTVMQAFDEHALSNDARQAFAQPHVMLEQGRGRCLYHDPVFSLIQLCVDFFA